MTTFGGRVLVTGADGLIGSHVAALLARRGNDVVGTTFRGDGAPVPAASAVPLRRVDVTRPATLSGLCAGVGAVVHCAAVISVRPGRRRVVWVTNTRGTANVLAEAARAGVGRVVLVSSVSVYGRPDNLPVSETHPYGPASAYARSKVWAEQRFRSACRRGDFEGVIVRPSFTYGPGDRRTLPLFGLAASGRLPIVGSGRTPFHGGYVIDIAAGIAAALDRGCGRDPRAYHLAGPDVTTTASFLTTVARAAGRRPPRRVPPVVGIGAAVVGQFIGLFTGERMPFDFTTLSFLTQSEHWDISEARRRLGFEPKVGVEEGIRRTVDWYSRHRWFRKSRS